MKSSKDKYLSKTGSETGGNTKSILAKPTDIFTTFEKLILFLLFIFLLAFPAALVIRMDIMIYVGLINILVLGIAIAVKPGMVIEFMRKGNPRFEEVYGKRLTLLSTILRISGVLLFIIGAELAYLQFLK